MDQETLKEELRAKTHMLNPAMWILDNEFINENQQPIEFDDHRFMLQPYSDKHPDVVTMKSAQIGWSVKGILDSIHDAGLLKLNVIYVLPTRNASAEFVVPKVDPMLQRNPKLKAMVQSTDNKSLKRIGDRFIYFKGAHHEGEAISTSADVLVMDEYDRCNQSVLITYQSRLQASKYGWQRRFSNPSIPAFGVHELFQNSDQMHWFITCHDCGYERYISLEQDEYQKNHYIKVINDKKDEEEAIYACGKCHQELTDDDRQGGRWVARYPHKKRRGYWISQLIIPWVSASKIIKQRNDMSIDVFHNMVLGLPYQASELLINRQAIVRCLAPGTAETKDCFLGVDNGIEKHWVLGNSQGVFAYGKTEDWKDIEMLMRRYNATTVIDANPYPNIPKKLAKEYPNKVFIHYYQHDTKQIDVSWRDEGKNLGVMKSDRTKLLDAVAADISTQSINFFMTENKMEEFIYHCENSYRVVEEDAKGIKKGAWLKKENRPDHYLHALAYYKVALGEALTSEDSGAVYRRAVPNKRRGVTVHREDESYHIKSSEIIDLDKSIQENSRKGGARL